VEALTRPNGGLRVQNLPHTWETPIPSHFCTMSWPTMLRGPDLASSRLQLQVRLGYQKKAGIEAIQVFTEILLSTIHTENFMKIAQIIYQLCQNVYLRAVFLRIKKCGEWVVYPERVTYVNKTRQTQ